jgi:hypothetical protein
MPRKCFENGSRSRDAQGNIWKMQQAGEKSKVKQNVHLYVQNDYKYKFGIMMRIIVIIIIIIIGVL